MIQRGRGLWLVVAVVLPACSSDGASGRIGTDAGAGGASGASSTSGGAAGTAHAGGTAGTGGKTGTGGGSPLQASAECVKYCDCMATNCADKVFPDGCLPSCASQKNWDLPCRQNMCKLAPLQPDNNHCTHAFAVQQCLDM